ncbi:hypothetical protein [Deinococcus aquiradiocola]|uniref:Phage tail tape measure protein n=1 Tax=Deinococcus aquiradiocola TaxID=393059 RepID=A0A917P7E6_9DEIO|nr:hypothetical protein [Deinococcus aquiradiocola]GGJ65385.1 hypothetical protein GCM10008939_06640 [Deinococcus aquiradiocola]
MEIRDVAVLDISNVLTNLSKLEATYKATGARLGSSVRLQLDTSQAEVKLRDIEARLTGLRGRVIPVNLQGAGAAVLSTLAPKLNPDALRAIEAQVTALAERLLARLTLTVKLRMEGGDPFASLIATVNRTVQAIEALTAALASAGKLTGTYGQQAQGASSTVANLARTIKQLAQEQKNGQIGAAELTASMTALRAQVTQLSQTTTLGSRDAIILGQAYRTASAALGETAAKVSPLAESIELIRVKVSALRAAYQNGTIGEQQFIAGARTLIAEGKALNVTLDGNAAAFRNLQVALRPATSAIDALEGKMSRLGLASQVGLGLGKTNQLLSGFANSLGFLPGPLGLVAAYAQTAASALRGMGVAELAAAAPAAALGVALVGLAAALGFGLHDAAEFERAMTQVGAIGSLTAPEVDRLGKSFLELSTQVPVTARDLSEFSRQAETLGIHGADGLQNYVDVMSNLKLIIRDVTGGAAGLEHTGQEMVKFLRSVDSKDINGDLKVTANTLVDLKTKFGAAIPNVVGLATYFSSGAKAAGATNEQILALSAALVSVGARPQSAGSSLARLFVNIQGAVNGNEKSAKAWAAALQLSTDEFKRLGKESPAEVIKLLSERLAEAAAKGIPLSSIYATLGIKGQQYVRTVNELALAHDRLGEAYDVANEGARDTDALQRRAREATQNFSDQVQILKNTLYKLGVEIGSELLPAATALIKGFAGLLQGGKDIVDYMPSIIAAITGLTLAFNINRLAAKAMLAQDAIGGFFTLVRSQGVVTALAGLTGGVGNLTRAFVTFRAATAGASLLEIGALIASLPAVIAAGLAAVTLATTAVIAYDLKLAADVKRTYREIDESADQHVSSLLERVKHLRAEGPLGKLKAEQQLTIDLRYNYQNSPERDAELSKKLAGLKVQIAAQEALDKANKKNADTGGEVVKATEAQIVVYQGLEDKLVAVSEKYGQDKLTPFQTGVAAARKEVESLTAAIQAAIDKGQLTEAQGKGLMGQAGALANRAVSELTRRQLDDDAAALRGHERDIQNGLAGLITDAGAKRRATLDQEVKDLQDKYAPAIKAALQNAKSAPAGQRGDFLKEAGQLQQQQAQEIVIAQRKANVDLEALDRDRGAKVIEAQQKLLTEQQKGLQARTALLQQEQQAAITNAGDSAQAQVDAARRYAPLVLAAKRNELLAANQIERQQAQIDLTASLRDAETAGNRRGELELAARQTYLQRIRNANTAAQQEYETARLASVKDLQDREAAVVKEGVARQLADTGALTGRARAELAAQYQAGAAQAAAAGNAPVVAAYRDALKQLRTLQQDAINGFRTASAEVEKSIRDLSKKLRDAQPASEQVTGRRTARQPFDDIVQSGQDTLRKLREDFGKLNPADQTGARLQRYLQDTQTLEGQIAQARADGNAASLRADLTYNAKRIAEANATAGTLRQGELTLAESRRQLSEKTAGTDAAQLAARQNLIDLDAKAVRASEDALARLPAERAAALAAVPAQQTEERARVAAQYAERQLTLQNDLVGKRGALYDAVQGKVELETTQEARNLGLQDARNKLLEARAPIAQRALLTAQLDVQASEAALTAAERALTRLQQSGAGRDALAAQELAVTNAQTDALTKREALEKAVTDEVSRRVATAQLELDLSQARQRANAQITGQSEDAVAAARLELDLTAQTLTRNREQQAAARSRVDGQDDLLRLQAEEANLLGTQAQQQRTLTQAVRDRQTLLDSITASQRTLGDQAAQQLTGTASATRALANAREDLGASERRYAQAAREVQEVQNERTLNAYKSATDDLTSKLQAQRQAVQGLADAYRQQVGDMDGVRSATERLATLVRGPDTGKIAQGDVVGEIEKLKAIQGRRDQALGSLQQAIQSGDAKRIQQSENDLTTQEERYRKQAERLTKGAGLQVTLQGEGQVSDILRQLEQLGVTYDQLSPELQARADGLDKEARSAQTLADAMSVFAGPADRLAAALSKPIPVPAVTPLTSGAPTLPSTNVGGNTYRGGDTINISIPITLDGQPVPTPEEFRQIARGEIAGAIQDARRSKEWNGSTC